MAREKTNKNGIQLTKSREEDNPGIPYILNTDGNQAIYSFTSLRTNTSFPLCMERK
jgi:hypothetical protein